MKRPKLDYNQLAGTYHKRYKDNDLKGIETALSVLACSFEARQILEVGCGTGRWVESLRRDDRSVSGVDSSTEMVAQATKRLGSQGLTVADANHLPFPELAFDFIFTVNATHHFEDPASFIRQAWKLLRPKGVLALVSIDPRAIRRRYYYDYFEGALALDLGRYLSFGELVDNLVRSGFDNVELRIIDRYDVCFTGDEIFKDPFLEKKSNSLLALLEDQVYVAGLEKIRRAVQQNPQVQFRSEIGFGMIAGVRN